MFLSGFVSYSLPKPVAVLGGHTLLWQVPASRGWEGVEREGPWGRRGALDRVISPLCHSALPAAFRLFGSLSGFA